MLKEHYALEELRRRKPGVAYINASNARQNIEVKLGVLVRAIEAAKSPLVEVKSRCPEYTLLENNHLPTSMRQFNAWASTALPGSHMELLPKFFSNANVTLSRNEDLKRRCEHLLDGLRQATSSQKSRTTADGRVSNLLKRVILSESLQRIAERELASALVEVDECKGAILALRARCSALEREARAALEAKDEEIASLMKTNAGLVGLTRNVRDLRGHNGG